VSISRETSSRVRRVLSRVAEQTAAPSSLSSDETCTYTDTYTRQRWSHPAHHGHQAACSRPPATARRSRQPAQQQQQMGMLAGRPARACRKAARGGATLP
jgi:hypothetical protein